MVTLSSKMVQFLKKWSTYIIVTYRTRPINWKITTEVNIMKK